VASTNLRLLLDESVTEPLATLIIGLVPSVTRSTDTLGQGATDSAVAALANSAQRTIVALDSDFKKHKVDGGVIRLTGADRADDHCLYMIFRAFWQSGKRGDSRKRRTFLTREGMRVENGETVAHKWKHNPCTAAKRGIRLIEAARQ
jgi:hypothetical protein